VDWFHRVRLYEDIGYRTPSEVEAEHYHSINTPGQQPLPGQLTVH
jgi:hypothetical protein